MDDAARPDDIDQAVLRALPAGVARSWGLGAPSSRRGRRPRHTLTGVLSAAMHLADTEGIDALSMSRLAGRLGLTTNAVYRYVESKEELLVLLQDAAFPDPPAVSSSASWREATTAWVRAVFEGYRTHPWLLELPVRSAPLTPNALRWLESLLRGLEGTGLSLEERLQCAILLTGHIRSTAAVERELAVSAPSDEQATALAGVFGSLLRDAEMPLVARLMSGTGYHSVEPLDEEIDFGLRTILDGIGQRAATS